jgi:tetratricopeptide (TPR) repeat protein
MPPAARPAEDPFGARAVVEHTRSPEALESFVRDSMAAERYSAAIAALELGGLRLPDFARGYLLLAHVARVQGSWAVAANYYRALLARRPDDAAAQYGLAKSLEQLGESHAAVCAMQTFLRLERRSAARTFIDDARATIARLIESWPPEVANRIAPPGLSSSGGAVDRADLPLAVDRFDFDPAGAIRDRAARNPTASLAARQSPAEVPSDSLVPPLLDPGLADLFGEPFAGLARSRPLLPLTVNLIDPFIDSVPGYLLSPLINPFVR